MVSSAARKHGSSKVRGEGSPGAGTLSEKLPRCSSWDLIEGQGTRWQEFLDGDRCGFEKL